MVPPWLRPIHRRAYSVGNRVNQIYRPGSKVISCPDPSTTTASSDFVAAQRQILASHKNKTWTRQAIEEVAQKNMLSTLARPQGDLPQMANGDGVYLVTSNGKRIMDFYSQPLCFSHGETGDARIIQRVVQQMRDAPYVHAGVAMARIEAELSALLADIFPGSLNAFLFPSSGQEAMEVAVRAARLFTGRHKVFFGYRSHTGGAMGGGDPQRWDPSAVKMWPCYPYSVAWGATEEAITSQCLTLLNEQLMYEGPGNVAAIALESHGGSSGTVKLPKGYLEGVRALCDAHGIVMVVDEAAAGFGHTGELFGFMHSPGLVPDIVTFAKGVCGASAPFGGVALGDHIAEFLRRAPRVGFGSTAHPTALAAAHEALLLLMEGDLVGTARRLGPVMAECLEALAAKHPCVKQVRAVGLCGVIDIQKDQQGRFITDVVHPLPKPMKRFQQALLEAGLFAVCQGHSIFANPPITITEEELRRGFAIIDDNLAWLDMAMEDFEGAGCCGFVDWDDEEE